MNRFAICQRKGIHVFVEDDLHKALRLADICDVVFLMKHPYNQNRPVSLVLPNNIVAVDGWLAIHDFIRYHL